MPNEAAADPIQLTIVYEPTEQGWITASVPAVPGTISAGRSQQKARENVLDALRLMLGTAPETPAEHVRIEQVEITLDLARGHDRGHEH